METNTLDYLACSDRRTKASAKRTVPNPKTWPRPERGEALAPTGNPRRDQPWHFPAGRRRRFPPQQRYASMAERVLLRMVGSGGAGLPDGMSWSDAVERANTGLDTLARGLKTRALHPSVYPQSVAAVATALEDETKA